MSGEDRSRRCAHEAGHVVAALANGARVSTVTVPLSNSDTHAVIDYSNLELEQVAEIYMAGEAGETAILGAPSIVGSFYDIGHLSQIAGAHGVDSAELRTTGIERAKSTMEKYAEALKEISKALEDDVSLDEAQLRILFSQDNGASNGKTFHESGGQ